MTQLAAQMKLRDKEMVPRVLVQGMFALMLCSLALVSFAVFSGRPLVGVPKASPIVTEVSLRMEGSPDGNAIVYNDQGQVVAQSNTDKNGFIGVMWRVMARERALNNAPETAPIRLVRRANGHVAILDTVTDWSIELVGYGPDNVAAFARLVD